MNASYFKHIGPLMLAVVLSVALAACDFSGLSNIEDEFDLVIGLPEINTVVNGQIVDASTGQPLRQEVKLTFSGDAGSQIIDAYSDPIQEIRVKGGVVSFGINNSLSPSDDSPVRFELTAKADGYFTERQTVSLVETGNGEFIVRLPSKNVGQSVGTSTTDNSAASSSSTGQVSQQVTVQTPAQQTTQAQATATVAQGTVPVTIDGKPLTGQLRTQLSVYDPKEGQTALPSAAKQSASGKNLALAAAAFFKMSDGAGNVASTFQGGNAGKTSGTCEGGVAIDLAITDANIVAAFNLLTSQGEEAKVEIYGYTLEDGQNNQIGAAVLEAGATSGEVVATVCLGGTTPTVNVGELGDISDGVIYSAAFAGGQVRSCEIGARIVGNNPNSFNVGITNIALVGPGLNIKGHASFPALPGSGTHELKQVLQITKPVTFINGATYTATGYVNGELASLEITDPCQGDYSLALPVLTGNETYTLDARLACPAGKKFDVQLTEQSVDALSVSYKVKGGNDPYTFLRKKQISRSVTESAISASTSLSLQPSKTYEIYAVYGTESTTVDTTTPAQGGTISLDFDAAEAGLTCK